MVINVKELNSCIQAVEQCVQSKTFTIAHLYKEEKAMEMHIHDCYELYYSISGGKQFLIDNRFYTISPGDLFIINQYESHKLTQIDKMVHERIVLSVHPDYIKTLSTAATNLGTCFTHRNFPSIHKISIHKISLQKEHQKRFLYLINKMTSTWGYGHDIIEQSAFMELMVMINSLYLDKIKDISSNDKLTTANSDNLTQKIIPSPAPPTANEQTQQVGSTITNYKYNQQVNDILNYINNNISQPIALQQLSDYFYLSPSYICRIFKSTTGTTINKYITARRISIAKSLLGEGVSVIEAYEKSGFSDYSNFYKAFSKTVGVSPKKYALLSLL